METQNGQVAGDKQKFNINNMLLAFIIVIVVIVVIALVGILFLKPKAAPIVGQVEVEEVRVSGKVPGRIVTYYVEEGQQVKAGDTLVRIHTPEVEAKLAQAKAAQQAAEAQRQKAMVGAREETKRAAFEMWQKAKAGLEIAQKSYERVKKLYEQDVIPAQKYDEVSAQLQAMQATERAAKSQYDMAVNGAQREDKMAAAALVDRAGGAIQEVDSYLKEGALLAPLDGVVSEIFPHRGELVGSGAPIMNIYDPGKKKVVFSIREDLLGDKRIGVEIKGHVPALQGKELSLRIVKVKDMGTYAAWKAAKPSEQIDLRTFELTAVPTDEGIAKDLLPGMSVVLH
ncbi:hemolysin secretion protein D [Porphyromonas crevioricanis]|uniref:Hemolysin secretion protein D n=2 Tax=Porphyromonas crevioricanis TaxID=393921 RepID=A0A0A2FUD8_9PORP|nr:biotin/lipoyl-binding protein [Porphyromonas crevioricanis]KGN89673.1 hemolysin secretion protein D [Porphyromonas crevioricanis]KGN93772.1 hemolysin secretion protein D [Porphyromonas crevioricanis]SJZ78416.1 HlyD family secretion protein [Porphyromonas crevioricanis]SQH72393.1 putative efflux pump membrane fusion protein [Porphyromonas crevioricanis]GAD04743.1 HlyD family secretion protein [Porphyromonas crevioricanis JCM 15906]